MCDTCGCNITPGNRHMLEDDGPLARTGEGAEAVTVLRGLLDENDRAAAHNRQHFDALGEELRIGVIEGDLETENDALRIRARGVEAIQITTGTACHLDAHMVHDALHGIALDGLDVLFVENVGNLVCPASFDLGQHRNLTLLSVTEGDDKPAKYPVMFRAADLMLLTKCDLLPYIEEFDPGRAETALRGLASEAPVLRLSSKTGEGLDAWLQWLHAEVEGQRARLRDGATAHPKVQPEGRHLHSHG
jgi:hydrogenase nickel incorporation protein HypB